eukprot:scaffold106080_cov39-Phaeocystis_antarctica.AAC.1
MAANWTCSGCTWAAATAARSSKSRRASVTDASGTPSSLTGASWTCSGGTWAAATAAKSSESRQERASPTQAARPAASEKQAGCAAAAPGPPLPPRRAAR